MTIKAGYRQKPERSAGKRNIFKLAIVSGIGLVLFAGLLFVAAVICLRSDASGYILPVSAFLCCTAASFPVGCIAAKTVGKSGMLCGLITCAPMCLFLLILCLALYGSVASGFWIGAGLILCFGALGGITAVNIRRKKRYR